MEEVYYIIFAEKESRMSIPLDIFTSDSSLTGNDDLIRERRLLNLPQKGDIVGIDAEFISMSKVRRDGLDDK